MPVLAASSAGIRRTIAGMEGPGGTPGGRGRGSQALADSLRLQRSAQQRAMSKETRGGRRRKGEVVDLDQRTISRNRRRRILLTALLLEALIAAVALAVFVVYLMSGRVE